MGSEKKTKGRYIQRAVEGTGHNTHCLTAVRPTHLAATECTQRTSSNAVRQATKSQFGNAQLAPSLSHSAGTHCLAKSTWVNIPGP